MSDKAIFQSLKKYATELSKEDDITKSFPYLCLKIYFPKLSDEDIEQAIQGLNSDDESIDAFWIDDDDQTVHIAQFKSSTSEKRAKESRAEKSWFSFLVDIDRKLRDDDFIKNCKNDRIKTDIVFAYRQAIYSNYSVKRYLFHLGYCTENITHTYSNIKYYSFDDISEKYKEFQSMTSYENPAECEINLSFPADTETKVLKYQAKYKGNRDTYVVILTGRDLINLRKEYRYQLFNRNVRYFLGETNSVNKKIIETAKENPEIFYCYNNGITITCSQCQIKNNKLKLVYPQIINGAQTVNSLYSVYETLIKERQRGRTHKDKQEAEWSVLMHFDNIKILCRIVTSTKGDQTDFANNLTKYTNSQNDVKVFDFCANRPEQRELQKKFAKYGYFYERKRGERDYLKKSKLQHEDLNKTYSDFNNWDTKINIQTLAGIYQAYLGKPSYAETDYKTILSNFSRDDYKEIFGANVIEVTDEKVKSMILAVNIYNIVDIHVKSYEKAYKAWLELLTSPNNEDKIKVFKDKVNQIDFIKIDLKEDINKILNFDTKTIEDLNKKFIKKYALLSRSKYMLTGLIKYILEMNNYMSFIIENNLFDNSEYLNYHLRSWIRPMLTDIINAVYADIERNESISMEKFYKRTGIFEKLINKIDDLRYDRDDWNLKTIFKLGEN